MFLLEKQRTNFCLLIFKSAQVSLRKTYSNSERVELMLPYAKHENIARGAAAMFNENHLGKKKI